MATRGADRRGAAPGLELHLPRGGLLDQDEEWCEVVVAGERRRVRFHDYDVIYGIPGLYERLFHDVLECTSPSVVRTLLGEVLRAEGVAPAALSVLDVGAGNGMVGAELRALGVGRLTGIDILPEAAAAVRRDRPGIYDAYHVVDLTDLTADERATLAAARPDAMVTVAALGFGDIPPAAFATAFNLVATPGLLAFNIKQDFVADDDPSGFSHLIRRMLDEGVLVPLARRHHRHRLSVHGEPLYYVAFVARKLADVPAAWLG